MEQGIKSFRKKRIDSMEIQIQLLNSNTQIQKIQKLSPENGLQQNIYMKLCEVILTLWKFIDFRYLRKTVSNSSYFKPNGYLAQIKNQTSTAQKMKFSFMDFFSKCDEIRSFLRIWWHLLKESIKENLFFVQCMLQASWSTSRQTSYTMQWLTSGWTTLLQGWFGLAKQQIKEIKRGLTAKVSYGNMIAFLTLTGSSSRL